MGDEMNTAIKAKSRIRVLVADPHPVVCDGLEAMLSRQPDLECVGKIHSGQETLRRFNELRPDVLVTEITFPDLDGLRLLAQLREQCPSACLLVLSLKAGDEAIYQALHAGAKGYYFKDVSPEAIADAIRAVYAGQSTLDRNVATALALRLQTTELTAREREILRHLAQGQSNQEIGRTLFIAEGTVKAHVNSIFAKLGVNDRTQAVVLAIKRGLVPEP